MNTFALATFYVLFFSSLMYAQRELEIVYPYQVNSETASIAVLDRKDGVIYRHIPRSEGTKNTHFFTVADNCSDNVVVFLDESLSSWSSVQILKKSITTVTVPDSFHVLNISASDECLRRIRIEKADAFFEVLDISSGSLNPYLRLAEQVNSNMSNQKWTVNGLKPGKHMLLVRTKFNGVPVFVKEFLVVSPGYSYNLIKNNVDKKEYILNIHVSTDDLFTGIVSYMSTFPESKFR